MASVAVVVGGAVWVPFAVSMVRSARVLVVVVMFLGKVFVSLFPEVNADFEMKWREIRVIGS